MPGSTRSERQSRRCWSAARCGRPPEMPNLSPPLRKQLEAAVREARTVADAAAKDAIERLAVVVPEAPAYLSDEHKALRRCLRAHARSLGDTRSAKGEMTT